MSDITYVRTWSGWLYVAITLDVCSRRVVGWSMGDSLRTELVLEALDMALWERQPGAGLIHHSDRGSQYTSFAFGRSCHEHGIAPSMGSKGDAYDNSMAESFFATLETELLWQHVFRTRGEARLAIFDFVEAFYNRDRVHSSIGQLSSVEFERRFHRESVHARTKVSARSGELHLWEIQAQVQAEILPDRQRREDRLLLALGASATLCIPSA